LPKTSRAGLKPVFCAAVTDLTPGLRDELVTAAAGEALLRVDDELIEMAEVEGAEAPDRFARHAGAVVRRVLERMRDADASAEAQALAVNEIIGALTDEDKISLPPSVLTGVRRPAEGLGIPILPARPMIALSANELLVNGHAQPAIGQQIRSELPSATDIDFLVSFVRWTGVRTLIDELAQVVERGGRVRVITTTYMSATEPKALEELAKVGACVRVDYEADRTKLHAKAWIIHRPGGLTTAFLGSSNISYAALHQGMEWNVRLSELANASLVERMSATFETYWANDAFEPFEPERDGQRLREALDSQRRAKRRNLGGGFVAFDVAPKPHQARMLEQLQAQRDRHDRHRNLLVAATGTGKTVMAALDYRRVCDHLGRKPSLLFVAHRRRILDQSRATYATILRDPDFGEILGDGEQPLIGRHVFAMVQSLRNEVVEALDRDAFEVVVIDEVHHAAAPSYRALLEHLRPTELLGLTATPERMDGEDITRWFGHRTAVELRLWEAIDDGYLAPFQYFGVHDDIDLSTLEWRRGGYRTEDLERIFTGDDARVMRLLRALDRILLDTSQMRALGFCVSVDHAKYMARAFTDRGIPSAALSGETGSGERDAALRRLEHGDIRCVFSVDVLGEGVDVPSVDTVLLLRPTQSATVLTQQIGRGLREHQNKATLTVVDLIGQQHRRFRFDTKLRALLDPRNGRLVDQVEQDFPYLPAGCEIKLDSISRDVILHSLRDAAGSGTWSVLRDDLRRLGDVSLKTFLEKTERGLGDLYRGRDRTWTRLRREAGLSVATGNRHEETLLRAVHRLLHVDDLDRVETYRRLLSLADTPVDLADRDRRLLSMLAIGIFGRRHGFANLEEALRAIWDNRAARDELAEVLEILGEEADIATRPLDFGPLQVHARYTRDEALLALGDGTFENPPTSREGVRWLSDLRTDILFVTLRKSERHYSPSTRYRDYALSSRLFHWESQSTTSADSPTGRRYREQHQAGTNVLLFVRESPTLANGAGAPFTLLGPATFVEARGERPIQVTWRLREPIPESLLEVARLVAA
jgi:superfamily II DNA or RNA helicase/HKD family nuclease